MLTDEGAFAKRILEDSRHGLITLLPGDVIATGAPSGVGHARGLYLKPGDVVTITIQGLGSIRNPVIAGF